MKRKSQIKISLTKKENILHCKTAMKTKRDVKNLGLKKTNFIKASAINPVFFLPLQVDHHLVVLISYFI